MEAPFCLMMWRAEMVAQIASRKEGVRIVLASASPRRAELLRAAGFEFDVAPAHVDETVHDAESPGHYVRRVAEAKAQVIHREHPGRVILAADTSVVLGSEILGKPGDASDAIRMLRLLSGRSHDVLTGVTVVDAAGAAESSVARTTVEFAPLTAREIEWYVSSGEPLDKAGAYAIQGLASRFVRRIEGSYSNVVGLPVALVYEMLRRAVTAAGS
jgi:septum formation protein